MRRITRLFGTLFLIIIIGLICMNCSHTKTNNKKADSFTFLAKPEKIIAKYDYGYTYITRDTAAKVYDWLIPDPQDEYVIDAYLRYIKQIKEEYKQGMVVNNIHDFPRKWNSVFIYKGEYFVYGPPDWMENTGYYVSDSVIYQTKSDPSHLFFILNYKFISNDLSEFQLIDNFGKNQLLRIKLVNPKFGIYVWTFLNKENKLKSRILMQDNRFAKKLPMIVCDCGDVKCLMDFKFDNPDIDKLINKK